MRLASVRSWISFCLAFCSTASFARAQDAGSSGEGGRSADTEAEEDVEIDLSTNRYRIEGDLNEPLPGIDELRTRKSGGGGSDLFATGGEEIREEVGPAVEAYADYILKWIAERRGGDWLHPW